MKLLQLHLKAFGPFSDQVLDLSPGHHGLHIVYGANEAGKSSSLRAISDLLFGIPARTPDDFIHPYPKLRIGAVLQHSDGSTLEIIRRKATKNSLFDGNDSVPQDESSLGRFLGDIDRDLFHLMFGIDHHRLRQGGEQIVQGNGRVGELLFSAGAGVANLQTVQRSLREEANLLLKPSGRSGQIADDIKEYRTARDEVKGVTITAEAWTRYDSALKAAESEKHELDEKIRQQRAEQNRLTRIRDSITTIAKWRKAKDDLSEVSAFPLLSDDFEAESQRLLVDLRTAQQQKVDAENSLTRLTEEIAGLVIPDRLLNEADAAEAIRDRLGSYRKAMADRPKLETSRQLAENEALEILKDLGRVPDLSQVETLRIPADRTIRIQNLGNQHEALIERQQAAQRDCDRIRGRLLRVEEELASTTAPEEPEALNSLIAEIQLAGDLETQLASRQEEQRELEEQVQTSFTSLGSWSGTRSEMEQLRAPSVTTIDQYSDHFKEQQSGLRTLQVRMDEKVAQKRRLEKQLAELELTRPVPTEDELTSARERREQGWQIILRAWQDSEDTDEAAAPFIDDYPPARNLSDAYRRAVDVTDQISDQLRSDADRVATKVKTQFEIAQCEQDLKTLEEELLQAETEQTELHSQWRELWESLGVSALTPAEMRDWLRHHQDFTAKASQLRLLTGKVDHLTTQIANYRQAMQELLQRVVPDATTEQRSLRELVSCAKKACDAITSIQSRLKQLRAEQESHQDELQTAEKALRAADQQVEAWKASWAAEMQKLGLSDDALPSQANNVLQNINRLFQKQQESVQFSLRIEGIDREASDFESDVKDLLGRTLPDLTDSPTDKAVTHLVARLKDAQTSEEQRKSLQEQLKEQQGRFDDAVSRISKAEALLQEMCRQASCDSSEELSNASAKSRRRRELERSVAQLEEVIGSNSGGTEFAAFVEQVESETVNFDTLEPRLKELADGLNRLEEQREIVVGQIKAASLELNRIDGRSMASERELDCESIASRLEERVQSFAQLRLATAILNVAIEQYRSKHQGPVLTRASEIFRHITLGNFSELRADFDESGEPVLTGVRGSGDERVSVAAMSDGTSDQLYLALRLASLESWIEHHEPLPLIVDDILLTFDDDRARATLEMLAEFSRLTQVIFFTHHQHLVDLAQEALTDDLLFTTNLTPSPRMLV